MVCNLLRNLYKIQYFEWMWGNQEAGPLVELEARHKANISLIRNNNVLASNLKRPSRKIRITIF